MRLTLWTRQQVLDAPNSPGCNSVGGKRPGFREWNRTMNPTRRIHRSIPGMFAPNLKYTHSPGSVVKKREIIDNTVSENKMG